jgi:hypothetical protein
LRERIAVIIGELRISSQGEFRVETGFSSGKEVVGSSLRKFSFFGQVEGTILA